MGKIILDRNKVNSLALASLTVLDKHGKEHLVSNLWKDSNTVFIFLRHFSCIACRALVDQLWQQKESFDKKITRIVFIGNGSPQVIESFMADLKLQEPVHIYTDSSLQVFDACGMIRGIFHLLDPRGLRRMFEFGLQGYRQGPIDKRSGSHTQMGGIIAFKQTGEVVYHYLENYLGDFDYKFNPDIVRGEKDEMVKSNPTLSPPNQYA